MLQSIRTRLTAALLGMAITPLLVVGIVFAMMSYTALRQQALENLQAQADRVRTAVESFLRELEGELILLRRVHDTFSSSPQAQKWHLDELLAYENRFQDLSIISNDGMEKIRRSRGTLLLDKDLRNWANDPLFQYPLASGKTYFSPVHTDPDTGEPLLTISVPIQSPLTGKNIGVFRGEARLKKIWDLLASLPTREGEVVFMVDEQGYVVAHPDPSMVLRGSRFPIPFTGQGFTSGLNSEQVALAVARIDLGITALHVVAQRTEAAVLNLAHHTLLALAVLLVASVTIAATLSYFSVASITRPLQDLATAARDIQEGNLTKQVPYTRRDEVGELAEAFNGMTSRLRASLEEMAREIEERKAAEANLREHRATLRQILDTTPQSIFWKDRESVYLGCNRVFAEAAGLADPELIKGKTDFDLPWRREESEAYRADDHQVITSNRGKHHIIEPLQQVDGSRLWIDTTKVPLRDAQGRVYGVLGVYVDITEKRRAEEERQALEMQLRQGQKMEAIGTLAGGIAHDFNNILSIIFGFTELAMMVEDTEERKESLQQVYTAAERARNLVRQILTFSRKMEKQHLEPLQVSLIVKEALKMLRATIPSSIEIRSDIRTDALVLAEPTQIHQVMVNLCTNACHAMKEQCGVLAVTLEEVEIDADDYECAGLTTGRYLKLDVGDTGSGIVPEIREKIFEPYFTTKGLGEGTGLGLAVVHGIVKSHGGHITVYSDVGKGTNFHVYLPVLGQVAPSPSIVTKNVAPSGNGEQILFVDDEEQICTLANSILSRNGYRVNFFTDPKAALQAFAQTPQEFDLVITDMTMPHLTGANLAQRIFAVRAGMPIILCTGQSALIDKEKALSMGIRDFLSKPFPKQALLAAVRRALVG